MLFCNPAVCVCRQSHGGAAFLPLTSSRLPGCRRPGEGSQGVRRSCFAFSSYFSCHSWCDGFPELVHEKAAVAGLVPLRPDSEASPASVRRSSAEEAARVGAAAGRREGGTVGEDPGAGAAVPAHRPRQGGRFGRFSPGGDNWAFVYQLWNLLLLSFPPELKVIINPQWNQQNKHCWLNQRLMPLIVFSISCRCWESPMRQVTWLNPCWK